MEGTASLYTLSDLGGWELEFQSRSYRFVEERSYHSHTSSWQDSTPSQSNFLHCGTQPQLHVEYKREIYFGRYRQSPSGPAHGKKVLLNDLSTIDTSLTKLQLTLLYGNGTIKLQTVKFEILNQGRIVQGMTCTGDAIL